MSTALSRKTLREELLIVLSLTLLADAAYSIIQMATTPLAGGVVGTIPQVPFATQLADFVFGLAPVWLVLYLVRRSGDGMETIGLASDHPSKDALRGLLLAVVLGGAGLGLYLGAVALGINRAVIPIPPLGHWWTGPVIVMSAVGAALLEEVIAVGYLMTRLRQIGWSPAAVLASSALLRGSYHLYQGWGGAVGNLALGAIFALVFLRTRRLWPLIVAHFLIDAAAGFGYIAFRTHLPG